MKWATALPYLRQQVMAVIVAGIYIYIYIAPCFQQSVMAVKMARVAALPETSILDKKKKEKVASQ